jgi:hypothetical protein
MRDTHERKVASRLPWLLAGIGVLACLTAFTLVILHADLAESPGVPSMPYANATNHSCTSHTGGFPGIAAITPHLNLAANAASRASGRTATLPTFTADDASAWVLPWVKYYGLGLFQATGTVTIRSVTFVPQEQACQWPNLGLSLGLPAATPVCVVVLDGTFNDTLSAAGSAKPSTYSYAVMGFNGVTGNWMDMGVTNSLPAALAGPAMLTTPAS